MPDIFCVTVVHRDPGNVSAAERKVKSGQFFKRDIILISFKGVIVIKQFNNLRRCHIIII